MKNTMFHKCWPNCNIGPCHCSPGQGRSRGVLGLELPQSETQPPPPNEMTLENPSPGQPAPFIMKSPAAAPAATSREALSHMQVYTCVNKCFEIYPKHILVKVQNSPPKQ